MKKHHRIAPEVREQILGRIRDGGISVAQAAKDHGVSEAAIYRWLGSGAEGGSAAGEVLRLRRENRALLGLVGEITLKLSAAQKKS